ncbi:MAG: hypothetical protein ABEJ84_03840 [Halodesulfurarchaeum sp.]
MEETSSDPEAAGGGPAEGESNGSGLTRRRVAAGVATWATVSLAGCNYLTGPGDDNVGDGDDGEGTPSDTTVTTETTTTEDPGDGGGGSSTTTSCNSMNRFTPGMEIGFVVGVYDSATGSFLGEDVIESVEVVFPEADFDPIELAWTGAHEQFATVGWGGSLPTDVSTDSGTYDYEVRVEPKASIDLDPSVVVDQFTIG